MHFLFKTLNEENCFHVFQTAPWQLLKSICTFNLWARGITSRWSQGKSLFWYRQEEKIKKNSKTNRTFKELMTNSNTVFYVCYFFSALYKFSSDLEWRGRMDIPVKKQLKFCFIHLPWIYFPYNMFQKCLYSTESNYWGYL